MHVKKTSVYKTLNRSRPGVLALFDPDRMELKDVKKLTEFVCAQGVRAILIGTSLMISHNFDEFVARVKRYANKPVIIFPGCCHQVSPHADALFFLSLLSGRNSEFLIGEHVKAVFLIKEYNLEVIPVGYILVESGNYTSVEYISNTKPIPRHKSDIAMAHALTAQYFGMKYVYLEAGSGGGKPVPSEMIKQVKKTINIPLIVGGGICTTRDATRILEAGADFVVVGSIIEKSPQQFKTIMRGLPDLSKKEK
jgi:putative glycerol-1-phosphate prenyltransferase